MPNETINKIRLRKAKAGDEIGITKLIKAGLKSKTWLYTGVNKFSPKKIAILKKSLTTRNSNRKTFVATLENKIAAFVNYNYRIDGRLRHRIGLGWHVHPEYQNQGIGTQLLKFALADAKKKGFKRAEAEMAVKNISSWKIALKCGFKIEGIKKKALLMDNGKYIDTYIVGKIL